MTGTYSADCVFLFITESCNLACEHCYVSAHPGAGSAMRLTVVTRALDIAEKLGIKDLRLTGGEATIHPAFNSILRAASDRGFSIRLITNGVRLLKMPDPQTLLEQLSLCWISAYGPSDEIHERIGQNLAPPLSALVENVGKFARQGYQVGLSVLLLIPGSVSSVIGLLNRTLNAGIRRLRFIPLQPDGRAINRLSFDWSQWPIEISELYATLRSDPVCCEFDTLTINDVFDFGGRFAKKVDSCLLHHRKMWSVVPNGDVYPCCFTVYEPGRKIGNIGDHGILVRLRASFTTSEGNPPCRAFDKAFWPGIPGGRATCPISNIDLRGMLRKTPENLGCGQSSL